MDRVEIHPDSLRVNPFGLWSRRWLLLAAGDWASGSFNVMTVAWGSLGVMWNRPFAQVVVRPSRHTFHFMETHPTFTLCAFPEEHREALVRLGTTSGRNGDKLTGCGLTPMPSSKVPSPSFREADLVIECRTIYRHRFDPSEFVDPSLDEEYPKKDYHMVYYGEVVALWGIPSHDGSTQPPPDP